MKKSAFSTKRLRNKTRTSELLRIQTKLLDFANDTIMIRDLEDRIIYWNGGAERLYGWTQAEAHHEYVHSFLKTVFQTSLDDALNKCHEAGYWNGFLVHTTRDGRLITVDSRWTLYRDPKGTPAAILEINNDVTEKLTAQEALKRAHEDLEVRVQERTSELLKQIAERKKVEQALRESESTLRALSLRLMTAQEEERKRISRELHDDLGQILTSMRLDLQRALKIGDEMKRQLLIERVLLQNNESRQKLRMLSSLLRPGVLDDVGLSEAIQSYVSEYSVRTGIAVELQIQVENKDIPSIAITHLYRILQEALNNVSSHAEANHVRIGLKRIGTSISFEIFDDGIGMNISEIKKEHAFGLLGMKERAELIAGSFSIQSSTQNGTLITVTFPMKSI